MPRQRAERTIRKCERDECEQTFEVRGNAADAQRRFCGRPCARLVENQARSVRKQQEWAQSPLSLCPCGVNRIPYEVRSTTKYCSPACRTQYGKKKQRDPTKWVTITCQNPSCGRQVERYRNYGNGHLKYCSNECAQRHTKTKQHIVVDDAVVLDSPWEALFWGLCALRKLPVERFDREQGIEWQEGGWYAPDFWMPTLGLAVEVKGVEDPSDVVRWARFREKGDLAVLGRDDMHKLCKDEDTAGFLRGIATITKP